MSTIDWLVDPNIGGLPVVVILLVLLTLIMKIVDQVAYRRARIQLEAKNMELLARAEAGDKEAIRKTTQIYWPCYGDTVNDRAKAVARRYDAEMDWKQNGLPMLDKMDWLEKADLATRIYQLADFVHSYSLLTVATSDRLAAETGYTFQQTKDMLQRMVIGYIRRLSMSINLADEQAFNRLHVIVLDCRSNKHSFLRKFTRGIDYPVGWDEVMANRIRRPRVEDFRRHEPPKSGELADWAEVAISSADIVRLKLVLAYANSSKDGRKQLGEIYFSRVVEAVNKYDQANNSAWKVVVDN